MKNLNRRQFMTLGGGAVAASFAVRHHSAHAFSLFSQPAQRPPQPDNRSIDVEAAASVFPLSVASGDPCDSGVMLWTRIEPSRYQPGDSALVEVYEDAAMTSLTLVLEVDAAEFGPEGDYTLKVDLQGYLSAERAYYYRFVYAGVSSRLGRCRTSAPRGVDSDAVKLAVLTCQDYTNGYYGALDHVADDDSLDFVVHLGDFIYESVGDPRFQELPFEDRLIQLPSGGVVAMDLNDYRHLYQSYRSDRSLQRAMENHTWIIATDDHETANDAYWDYDRDTLGVPDHPYSTDEQYGNDPARLTQLKLDSQRAWLEYTPTRVSVNPEASHPHQYSRIYREFYFGDLLSLYMTDSRSYRSPHPCGEGDALQRYVPLGCTNMDNADRTMLGQTQKRWLIDGLTANDTRWKVMGNQTYMGRMAATLLGKPLALINVDAWDGYQAERQQIVEAVKGADVDNFVVLTGDLHSYISSYVKLDYSKSLNLRSSNLVGVEFMTPSVTSAGIVDGLANLLNRELKRADIVDALSEAAMIINNPHMKLFNSKDHGYSTIEFQRSHCEWTAYCVDKNHREGARTTLARHRKYSGFPWIFRQSV
ncbi:alkaline phosphatase D family protein [Ferrimonas kyonanensis]|uniref:alkaline phosphatase D family protein n=1 Tax=Ferrimonas kyonanensis TaxID=364763 RepID=UPI00040DF80B|nr:alkaline phosphatase D family protein [Ferrimonas kyonanensis]